MSAEMQRCKFNGEPLGGECMYYESSKVKLYCLYYEKDYLDDNGGSICTKPPPKKIAT
jgi:hypothetical protein